MTEMYAEHSGRQRLSHSQLRPWRELAIVASIFMELSWAVIWYVSIVPVGQHISYGRAFVTLCGMVILFYLPSRIMSLLDVKLLIRRSVLLILLVANLIIGLQALLYSHEMLSLGELLNRPVRSFADMGKLVPAEFVVMLFTLYVSWRGISYADRHIGPVNVLTGFRTGILMFFLYGLALPSSQETPYIAVYIFLFASLMALSTSRIAILNQLRGGLNIQFNAQWLLGITAIILGMVGTSALMVWLAKERLFPFFTTFFAWIIYLLVLLFSPLLWIFTRLLFWVFETIRISAVFDAIRGIFNRLQAFIESLILMVSKWAEMVELDNFREFVTRLAGYKPLYLWGIILVFVLIILLVLRRTIWKDERKEEQDSQSAVNDEDLLSYLKSALRRGLAELSENLENLFRLRQARQLLAAARIRRIYARLLALSAKLDLPRPAARTPLEFLPSLQALFPGLSKELATITNAYLYVRYGELPETPQELQEVEIAWGLISASGADQLKVKRRTGHT